MRTQTFMKRYVIEKLTYMSGPRVMLLFSTACLMVAGLVSYTISVAWSAPLPQQDIRENAAVSSQAVIKLSPTLADQCLPLLNSVSQSVPGLRQRQAGHAAALGLILGLQYALSPSPEPAMLQTDDQKPLTSYEKGAATSRSAPAIAAYRKCQKKQALLVLHAQSGLN